MSFSAGAAVEIVSQFAADAFGEVWRLEKVEVNLIQLGSSGSLKALNPERMYHRPTASTHSGTLFATESNSEFVMMERVS